MSRVHSILILLALSACGDDGDAGDKPAGAPAAPAAAPGAAPGAAGGLIPQKHVEDVVAPNERAGIRHTFTEDDFKSSEVSSNRDPFQSFVVLQLGLGPDPAAKPQATPRCTDQQLVATGYSYSELRLVGVVVQGIEHKVLMMDSGNLGHIVQRNDCVGKEKAFVKDIGDDSITFEVDSDTAQGSRAEQHQIKLSPTLVKNDYRGDRGARALGPDAGAAAASRVPVVAPTGPNAPRVVPGAPPVIHPGPPPINAPTNAPAPASAPAGVPGVSPPTVRPVPVVAPSAAH